MDRPPGHRRELHGQLERPAARVPAVERHGDRLHRRGLAGAHHHAPLRDADEGRHGGAERGAFGGHAAAPHEHRVHGLGELRELHVRVPGQRGHLDLEVGRQDTLARSVEHRSGVRDGRAPFADVRDDDRAAEPLAEHHRLLERRIGPRTAVESHQQAREHG